MSPETLIPEHLMQTRRRGAIQEGGCRPAFESVKRALHHEMVPDSLLLPMLTTATCTVALAGAVVPEVRRWLSGGSPVGPGCGHGVAGRTGKTWERQGRSAWVNLL